MMVSRTRGIVEVQVDLKVENVRRFKRVLGIVKRDETPVSGGILVNKVVLRRGRGRHVVPTTAVEVGLIAPRAEGRLGRWFCRCRHGEFFRVDLTLGRGWIVPVWEGGRFAAGGCGVVIVLIRIYGGGVGGKSEIWLVLLGVWLFYGGSDTFPHIWRGWWSDVASYVNGFLLRQSLFCK